LSLAHWAGLASVMALGVYPELSEKELRYVTGAIKEFHE
jgi:dTDP-4-amino-4,6-dideoxygalactose transaminase